MQLNTLQRRTTNKSGKRVGRGGLRGKTAGRGTKGQKARAGHRIRPDVREKLKKLPKLRGYAFNSIEMKPAVINLSILQAMFAQGDSVTPEILRERGAVRARKGVAVRVKILGDGELTKKLVVTGCAVSAGALQKIEKAGGSVAK